MGAARKRWSVGIVFLVAGSACATAGPPPAPAPEPTGPPPLSAEPVTEADERLAAELLEQARLAYERGELNEARAAAQQVVRRYPGTRASSPALWLSANAAHRQKDHLEAAEMAERYAALFPLDSDAARQALELADRARSAAEAARPASAAVLGVIVPSTGSELLRDYAELILEGVELAARSHGEATGMPVELVVLDDQGTPRANEGLIAELERRGVIGVVGPLLDESLTVAARARRDTTLVLVSPTATQQPDGVSNVYSLNMPDLWGAEVLAEYAFQAGLREVALLYPRSAEHQLQAQVFRETLERAGGHVVLNLSYPRGTTTFREHLDMVARSGARAIFLPVPERDVRQIAPQLAYYGLTDLQVFGGESWAGEDVRRMVEARFLEDVIVATPMLETSPDLAWTEFVELYESTYRRTLDNPFPALGYDAARLVLTAFDGRRDGRAEVARRIAVLDGLRGATGLFSVHRGGVLRRPFVMRIRSGELVPAPRPDRLFLRPTSARDPARGLR